MKLGHHHCGGSAAYMIHLRFGSSIGDVGLYHHLIVHLVMQKPQLLKGPQISGMQQETFHHRICMRHVHIARTVLGTKLLR